MRADPAEPDCFVRFFAGGAERNGLDGFNVKRRAAHQLVLIAEIIPAVGHLLDHHAGDLADLERDGADAADFIILRYLAERFYNVLDYAQLMHGFFPIPKGYSSPMPPSLRPSWRKPGI